jgi:general secretion pathway protein L
MNYLIVHLSADEVVFARFRKKGSALDFLEASRQTIDEEHPLAVLLAEVAAKGTAEDKIILALPAALFFMREVAFPITDRRKVRELLPLEMKGETAVDTEELVFDALPLEGGKFLAIWGKRTVIAEYIRLMVDAGLEPEIVTSALFYWHILLPQHADTTPVALTDGEALAVYHNGFPVFFRPLGWGTNSAEVAQTLAALEIGKGIMVEQVFLHGNAARQAADTFPGDAPNALSFTILPISGELAATFPDDLTAALDLAGTFALARACTGPELVNLRRGTLAYTAGGEKARKKLRFAMVLAAAIVLLLFAEVGLRYYLVTRDLASVNNSIKSIYREVFPARKKAVDEVAELRSELKRLGSTGAEYPLISVLKTLAELKGDDVTGIFEAEIEGGQVRLKGEARSVKGANDFKTRADAVFSGAELGEIKSRPDGSVVFSFKATLKGGKNEAS